MKEVSWREERRDIVSLRIIIMSGCRITRCFTRLSPLPPMLPAALHKSDAGTSSHRILSSHSPPGSLRILVSPERVWKRHYFITKNNARDPFPLLQRTFHSVGHSQTDTRYLEYAIGLMTWTEQKAEEAEGKGEEVLFIYFGLIKSIFDGNTSRMQCRIPSKSPCR